MPAVSAAPVPVRDALMGPAVRVGVVSGVFAGGPGGRFDTPRPFPAQRAVSPLDGWDLTVDAVMVTDTDVEFDGWRVVREQRGWMDPRMAAKVPRARPDLYAPGCDYLIWLDGNVQVKSDRFVAYVVGRMVSAGAGFAAYRHPYNDTYRQEAELAWTLDKYAGHPVREQASWYEAAGCPADTGMWWSGLFGVEAGGWQRRLGDVWLREMFRWGAECQVSLPYAMWEASGNDRQTVDLPWVGWDSALWCTHPHLSDR